jgi:hypothetical protein
MPPDRARKDGRRHTALDGVMYADLTEVSFVAVISAAVATRSGLLPETAGEGAIR